MIVDDYCSVRQSLSFSLQVFDDLCVVGQAQNGLEAVQLCSEVKPDVILMDVKMPKMNGVEAAKTICSRFPNIAVIMLSVIDTDKATWQAAQQAGAVAWLSKHVSIIELVQTIRNARPKMTLV